MNAKIRKKLGFVESLNNTGFELDENKIEKLDYYTYNVIKKTIAGDNPKNIIRCKLITPEKRNKWITYIAKTAGKWYPNESVTEYLIFRIGKTLGFDLAESKIVIAESQLRFLSRYFLAKKQQLSHGKELYINSNYFDDEATVEKIEREKKSINYFTLQITEKVIKEIFREQSEQIFKDLIKMIIFDAYVGNNDRHYENWAVVSHIENKHAPYFSPIYDTARGLFWNESETTLKQRFYPIEDKKFESYSKNSKPKIGWDGQTNINHFKLFKLITENDYGITKKEVINILSEKNFQAIINVVNTEFQAIISKDRSEIIIKYLDYRRRKLLELII